jgi:hypothetical protein
MAMAQSHLDIRCNSGISRVDRIFRSHPPFPGFTRRLFSLMHPPILYCLSVEGTSCGLLKRKRVEIDFKMKPRACPLSLSLAIFLLVLVIPNSFRLLCVASKLKALIYLAFTQLFAFIPHAFRIHFWY